MSEYMRHRRNEEGNEGFFCRFTFGQFFAILVLEVFTLFFVFYLGARYGREFLGLDPKGGKVDVAATEQAPSPADEPKVLSTDDPEAAKMARELMEKARTPELKERIGKMFGAASSEPRAASPGPAAAGAPAVLGERSEIPSSPVVISGGEERGLEGTARGRPTDLPTRQEGVARSPAGAEETRVMNAGTNAQASDASVIRVKSVENARYAVQVGSFSKLDEATRNVERWKVKGYSAYLMIADIPERGRWYRVRIGGFSSREEASRYLREFQGREGGADAMIVMNEQ